MACLLLSLSALLAACQAAPAPSRNQTQITWKPCPQFLVSNSTPGNSSWASVQCGYYNVPMDWDNGSYADSVTIGFVKIPARDPKNRIGSLWYNPGGPAAQASQGLKIVLTTGVLHPEIQDRFDLIGVDLRGSGLSQPIQCNRTLYNEQAPLYPTDPTSFQALIDRNLAYRQSCLDMTGSRLIEYMDTKSAAKDHEALRQALGGEKITYVGQSAGTLLGSQYAELYPDAFRAIILDGVNSNSPSETSIFTTQASTIDAALEYFFDWCGTQNSTSCPLAHRNETIKAIWTDLINRAEKSPIPAPQCKQVGVDCASLNVTALQIRQGVLENLYHPPADNIIAANAIYNASFRNDASTFAMSGFISNETSLYEASYQMAQVAFTCQDNAHASTLSDMKWREIIAKSQAPLMLGASSSYAGFVRQCLGWPAPKRNLPHKINIPRTPQLPPILIVTTVYDPSTPYPWSMNVIGEIGEDRARLLTRVAGGHTTYFQTAAYNGPTVAAMNKYLLTLELPEQGTVYQN